MTIIPTEDENRFIEGAKGSLYDSLMNKIDDRFHLTSFVPPRELVPFLEGEEIDDEEAQNIMGMYRQWTEGVMRALERKPKTAETLKELFAALPEHFRERLLRVLARS